MVRHLMLAIALPMGNPAGAAQFSMSGDAHLSQETIAQANARYSLRADLSPSLQTPSTVTQPGSRFALFATLSTVSLACYNDTIFRADFDGDGL